MSFCFFVCLSPKNNQFTAVVSIDDHSKSYT